MFSKKTSYSHQDAGGENTPVGPKVQGSKWPIRLDAYGRSFPEQLKSEELAPRRGAFGAAWGEDMEDKKITSQTNVHVLIEAFLCGLPSCRKPFTPKRTGKRRQRFCCPEHRKEFFRLARKMGQASLRAQSELLFQKDTQRMK